MINMSVRLPLLLWASTAWVISACGALPSEPPIFDSDTSSSSLDETSDSVSGTNDTSTSQSTATDTSGSTDETGSSSDSQTGTDSEDTNSNTTSGTDSGSETGASDTSSSDTETSCEPHYARVCSDNGREVQWVDSCGIPTGVFETCPTHGYCVDNDALDPPTASCVCEAGRATPTCEELYCPSLINEAESCEATAIIGRALMPFYGTNNTATASNNINVECNQTAQPGKDHAYRVYLFKGEVLVADLQSTTKNLDLSLSLFEVKDGPALATCDANTMLTCSNNQGTEEAVEWAASHEGWYILVVDSAFTDSVGTGTYNLHTEIKNPSAGQCYNHGGPLCAVDEDAAVELTWKSASIVSPMGRTTSYADSGDYVFTTQADLGTAIATVSIKCGGYYYITGYGKTPKSPNPPSTFFLRLDSLTEHRWELGNTLEQWVKLSFPGNGAPPMATWLAASDHTVVLRGGESLGAKKTDHPDLGTLTFTTANPAGNI